MTNQIGVNLNLWCASHEDDLALHNASQDPGLKDFFDNLTKFFRKLESGMKDEAHEKMQYYSKVTQTRWRTSTQCAWHFPRTDPWEGHKLIVSLLAEQYPDFVVLADKRGWKEHTDFLLRTNTYLCVSFLADMLTIYDKHLGPKHNVTSESKSHPFPGIQGLTAELTGYINGTKPTLDPRAENGVVHHFMQMDWEKGEVQRMTSGGLLQKALRALKWTPGKARQKDLKIHLVGFHALGSSSGQHAVRSRGNEHSIRHALKFGNNFRTSLISSLEKHFDDALVWSASQKLLTQAMFQEEEATEKDGLNSLQTLANRLNDDDNYSVEVCKAEYVALQHRVVQRMKELKTDDLNMDAYQFRQILLKVLGQLQFAAKASGLPKLHKLFVVALQTLSACSQLKDDLTSVQDLWDKHSKNKVLPEHLGKQVRMIANAKKHNKTNVLMKTKLRKAYDKWESETQHHKQESNKRYPRWDRGMPHRKKARRCADGLTEDDSPGVENSYQEALWLLELDWEQSQRRSDSSARDDDGKLGQPVWADELPPLEP